MKLVNHVWNKIECVWVYFSLLIIIINIINKQVFETKIKSTHEMYWRVEKFWDSAQLIPLKSIS